MKKKLAIILFALAAFGMSAPAQKCAITYLNTADFKTRIWNMQGTQWHYQGTTPVVIDFYTTWCGPCKRLAPIMEQLAADYCGKVVFYKVDIEQERELANKFNISSIPTLLFIPASGTPGLLQGLRGKEELKSVIDTHLLKSSTVGGSN